MCKQSGSGLYVAALLAKQHLVVKQHPWGMQRFLLRQRMRLKPAGGEELPEHTATPTVSIANNICEQSCAC